MKNLHSTKGTALEKLLWGLKVSKMRCFPLMERDRKALEGIPRRQIHPFSLCVETRWLRVARYSGGSIASTTLYLSPCKSPWKTSSVANSTLSPEPRPSPKTLLNTALKTPAHCIGRVSWNLSAFSALFVLRPFFECQLGPSLAVCSWTSYLFKFPSLSSLQVKHKAEQMSIL